MGCPKGHWGDLGSMLLGVLGGTGGGLLGSSWGGI